MLRSELPEHLRERSFSTRAADAAGVAKKRTHAKDLIAVSRGIRVPANVQLSGTAALAAYTEANPKSVLSHHSAARVLSIPLPPRVSNDWRIHLANPAATSRVRRVNAVGHRLALLDGEICQSNGVRHTSAARTWLDLATQLSLQELVAAGDYLVCRHEADFPVPRQEICGLEELVYMVSMHPGLRGLRTAKASLGLIRVGADSAPESAMRLALVIAGMPEPELNVGLVDEFGRAVLWPDAAYCKYRLSLQYDGGHHGGAAQYRWDMRRLEITRTLGWNEVRLSSDDLLGNGAGVVRKVAAALRENGWRP